LIDDKYNQLMFGIDGDPFCQSTQPIFKQVRLKLRRVLDMVARIASMSDSLISRMALEGRLSSYPVPLFSPRSSSPSASSSVTSPDSRVSESVCNRLDECGRGQIVGIYWITMENLLTPFVYVSEAAWPHSHQQYPFPPASAGVFFQ
jgi:hypothetical protein